MSADHWMRFNVGDYLADTMHLSTMQHGVYLLLIMHYFKRGELPPTDGGLARIAKIPTRQWRLHGAPVMSLFRRDEGGLWRHRRIDAERAKLRQKLDGTHAHARERPTPTDRARASEPELKLVKGGRAHARPTRGGFSHMLSERRAESGG